MKSALIIFPAVFCLAVLVALCGVHLRGSLDRAPGSDGPFYSGIAKSLATGKGYILAASPWPMSPETGRVPMWPLLQVPGMRLFPEASEFAVERVTGIIVHGLCAVLLAALTWRIWKDARAALFAGAGFSLYVPALMFIDGGYSELTFVLTTAVALLLLLSDKLSLRLPGAFVMGLGPLSRTNFVILPMLFILAAFLFARRSHMIPAREAIAMFVLFFVPALAWATRNYDVTGHFFLSTIEGPTLYGANNTVVANDVTEWAYWIDPDLIPGEIPKRELSKNMDQYALHRYYHEKGIRYIREHWFSYPRLLFGRIIRLFSPVPWKASWEGYLGFAFRDVLILAFLFYSRKGLLSNAWFRTLLWAMFGTTLFTAIAYYGMARLSFPLEAFLICVVAAGISASISARSRHISAAQDFAEEISPKHGAAYG